MITVRGVSKIVGRGSLRKAVLRDVDAEFPANCVTGIIGPRGCGKSTFLSLLSGAAQPDSGTITRLGRVSFPVGFGGAMDGRISVRENLFFIARIYGLDPRSFAQAVAQMTGLERDFARPFLMLPGDRKAVILYAISYCIDFDVYIVDKSPVIGRGRFRTACESYFKHRRENATFILATSSPAVLKKYCDRAGVLYKGSFLIWGTVQEALEVFAGLPEGSAAFQPLSEEEEEEEGLLL